jgi:hypothetical protein
LDSYASAGESAASYEETVAYRRTLFFFKLAFSARRDPDLVLADFKAAPLYGSSTFTVAGRRWRCSWEHNGTSSMSDRADWDNGWWPTFETPGVRRWLRRRWVRMWGRGRIAEAVAEGRIPAIRGHDDLALPFPSEAS